MVRKSDCCLLFCKVSLMGNFAYEMGRYAKIENMQRMDVQQEIIFRQIGAKVAYYRTLRGITQEKLAEKMGLHKSVISRIERGKYHNDLSLATLLKIAEKLQIDPSLFLSFNELEKKLWWEPLVSDENDDLYEEEEKN